MKDRFGADCQDEFSLNLCSLIPHKPTACSQKHAHIHFCLAYEIHLTNRHITSHIVIHSNYVRRSKERFVSAVCDFVRTALTVTCGKRQDIWRAGGSFHYRGEIILTNEECEQVRLDTEPQHGGGLIKIDNFSKILLK